MWVLAAGMMVASTTTTTPPTTMPAPTTAPTTATAGPDLAAHAEVVALPIHDVVVFSDRARINREGRVRFSSGPHALRLPDLPGNVQPGSIRVSARGATLVRVETAPVQRERFGIDQVDAWLAQLQAIVDKEAIAEGRLAAVRGELAMLSNLVAAAPLPEKDRAGKPLTTAPDAWRDAQDRLGKRRVAARTVEAAIEEELHTLGVEHVRLAREIAARDTGGFADTRTQVIAIVESTSDVEGTLGLEYAVPGASWRPAYDLAFDPDKGTVQLSAAGLVSQASGEDWPRAHLALSTSIPGEGIVLPTLRTWTLGDDREFIPTPAPRVDLPIAPLFAPPEPRSDDDNAAEAVRAGHLEQLRALVSNGLARGESDEDAALDSDGGGGGGGGAKPRAFVMPSAPPPPPPPPSAPMEAPMAKRAAAAPAAEAMPEYEMADEAYAPAPSVASSIAPDGADMRRRGGGRSMNLRRRDAWAPPQFSDPTLPAVSAAGFDVVYDAPLPATIPSDAQNLRVPLAVRNYDVTTYYEATPSLSTTAYLKATVRNGAGVPILAGPANIFVKGAFAGDATLDTTGPGGSLELPLGADEDIRLTRTVMPQTKRQGFVFGEEDVTEYVVRIEAGNYKKRPISLRVVDQVPKSSHEKVKIELVSTSIAPDRTGGAQPDGEGLLHWRIDIPAGGTKTLTFTYRIARPKDWRLSR